MKLIALLLCSMPAFGAPIQEATLIPSGTFGIANAFGSTPGVGHLLHGAVYTYNNGSGTTPTITCVDGASNSYTVTTAQGGTTYNGFISFFYILSAPSNITSAITCTSSVATGGFAGGWAEEWSYTGTASVDGSVAVSTGTGTSVVLPSITVTGTNDVLYSAITNPSGGLTANSPWTGNAFGSVYSTSWAAYDVTSATTTVNWTIGSSQPWTAMGIAFKFAVPVTAYTQLLLGTTVTTGSTIR